MFFLLINNLCFFWQSFFIQELKYLALLNDANKLEMLLSILKLYYFENILEKHL